MEGLKMSQTISYYDNNAAEKVLGRRILCLVNHK